MLQFVGETQTRTGKVIFVAPQVDVATGGLEVKIGFDTPQTAPVGALWPMLYALKIAARYLTASKSQTALLVAGVAVGVFIFIP